MLQQISQKTFGKNINEHLISGGNALLDIVTAPLSGSWKLV